MNATVHLHTIAGEELLTVRANDGDPFISLTLRGQTVDLTRDQARMASDALRAGAMIADGQPWHPETSS